MNVVALLFADVSNYKRIFLESEQLFFVVKDDRFGKFLSSFLIGSEQNSKLFTFENYNRYSLIFNFLLYLLVQYCMSVKCKARYHLSYSIDFVMFYVNDVPLHHETCVHKKCLKCLIKDTCVKLHNAIELHRGVDIAFMPRLHVTISSLCTVILIV